jgi:glutamate/tyrosine decarboxylase-like PLP-dependent enzyme
MGSKWSDENNRKLLDEAAAYARDLEGIEDREVFPSREALEGLEAFDEGLPEEPSDSGEVLAKLHRWGSPATVAQTGGRYFGFVNAGTLPAALGARWLADAWDQNAALYLMSPVISRLESVMERWLTELLGLPDGTAAGFVSGSSMATFSALAAARYRLLERQGWDVNRRGLGEAPPLRIVAGAEAHATVKKALALLGFGLDRVEWVAVDDAGRMLPEALPELDERTILILQAGHVNTGAFDPFEVLCTRAEQAGAWVHVDGAFGLRAAASESLGHLARGAERADSWALDGHKTLNTPYDNGILLCRDREALTAALQASGSYILYAEERDGMLTTPEMSRRGRVVELWAALKSLGRSGVADLVERLHERALQFAEELRDEGFAIRNEVVFNQVLVSLESDEKTLKAMDRIQRSGECWVGGAQWRGRRVIRISVSSWMTEAEDVTRCVRAFAAARREAERG